MRELTAEFLAELNASACRPALLLLLDFGVTAIRLWSGAGTLSWDGNTYLGNGWLQGVSPITETSDIRAEGMQVDLTGVPQDLVSVVLNEATRKDTATLWMAVLDANWEVVAEPYQAFNGLYDTCEIYYSPNSTDLGLRYESRHADIYRAREHRYTHEGQRNLYPEDEGFEYMEGLQKWDGYWGQSGRGIVIQRRGRGRR